MIVKRRRRNWCNQVETPPGLELNPLEPITIRRHEDDDDEEGLDNVELEVHT